MPNNSYMRIHGFFKRVSSGCTAAQGKTAVTALFRCEIGAAEYCSEIHLELPALHANWFQEEEGQLSAARRRGKCCQSDERQPVPSTRAQELSNVAASSVKTYLPDGACPTQCYRFAAASQFTTTVAERFSSLCSKGTGTRNRFPSALTA